MKKLLFILALIIGFSVKAQDSTHVDSSKAISRNFIVADQKMSYTDDKTHTDGYIAYYDILIKNKMPINASITTYTADKPFYTFEEMFFEDNLLKYYSIKKVYKGVIESNIVIIFKDGFAIVEVDGVAQDKEKSQKILERVKYSLYMVNDLFLKGLVND
jgi:hypothetical protein